MPIKTAKKRETFRDYSPAVTVGWCSCEQQMFAHSISISGSLEQVKPGMQLALVQNKTSSASNHLLLSSARKTEQANLPFGTMKGAKCQILTAKFGLKIAKPSSAAVEVMWLERSHQVL